MTRRSLWSLLLLVLFTACGDLGDDPVAPDDGPSQPPPATVSFATDIQPVFDARCVDCHGLGGFAGLDLRPGLSLPDLVGITATESALVRVAPGDPDNSWLYLKIAGQQNVGDRMPLGGDPLPADTIGLVRTWIAEGALDN
ncbi:MAG: hypothetical protein R3D98_11365 [Candidatus Krumholzibacteriia bacterium]